MPDDHLWRFSADVGLYDQEEEVIFHSCSTVDNYQDGGAPQKDDTPDQMNCPSRVLGTLGSISISFGSDGEESRRSHRLCIQLPGASETHYYSTVVSEMVCADRNEVGTSDIATTYGENAGQNGSSWLPPIRQCSFSNLMHGVAVGYIRCIQNQCERKGSHNRSNTTEKHQHARLLCILTKTTCLGG